MDGTRGAESALSAEDGERRDHRLLCADRAGSGIGRGFAAQPQRVDATTATSSTEPSASSRTRHKRSCSRCSRAPIRTHATRKAFPHSWSTPQSNGITLGPKNRKMGQQGAHVCDVIFEDCWVPESALLGGPANLNKGFLTAMKTLDRGRLHISALAVGCAERLIDDSLNYAIERKQFGDAIAQFQLIQAMLADSRTEAYAARCMVLDAARRRDVGEPVTTLASCCKAVRQRNGGPRRRSRGADLRRRRLHGRVWNRALLSRRAIVPHL